MISKSKLVSIVLLSQLANCANDQKTENGRRVSASSVSPSDGNLVIEQNNSNANPSETVTTTVSIDKYAHVIKPDEKRKVFSQADAGAWVMDPTITGDGRFVLYSTSSDYTDNRSERPIVIHDLHKEAGSASYRTIKASDLGFKGFVHKYSDFSADGKYLVGVGYIDDTFSKVFRFNVETGAVDIFDHTPVANFPSISGDGKKVVYVGVIDNKVCLLITSLTVSPFQTKVLAEINPLGFIRPVISKDGRIVVSAKSTPNENLRSAASSWGLLIQNSDDGTVIKDLVASSNSYGPKSLSVSEDGKTVVLFQRSSSGIYGVRAFNPFSDTVEYEEIHTLSSSQTTHTSVSADGRFVGYLGKIYDRQEKKTFVIPFATGQAFALGTTLSDDGCFVAYRTADNGPNGYTNYDGYAMRNPFKECPLPQPPIEFKCKRNQWPLPGDSNRDCMLDGSDFLVFQRILGKTPVCKEDGDYNENGTIDSFDWAEFQKAYQRRDTCGMNPVE